MGQLETRQPDEFVNSTIDQFMWGFQSLFRVVVQGEIEKSLSSIGLPVDVRVALVGFALVGSARHKVCVEPEDGPLSIDHLAAVPDRADELFALDPESQSMIMDPRLHELRRQGTVRRSRANALVEAIEMSALFDGLTFFASSGAPIGGYEVYTCVGVPAAALGGVPALKDTLVDRFHLGRSLPHEVITECLRRADDALYLPDPGANLFSLGATEDIVKDAAVRLTQGAVYRATGMPADLFPTVNAFTSLSYERAAAGGHLVIASSETAGDWARVRFQQPVPFRDARSMRKLLELSDDSTSILADNMSGLRAYGLGSYRSGPRVAEISVRAHAEWELSMDGSPLVRVTYGHPTLPRPLLDSSRFAGTAKRTVGAIDLGRIWEIVEEAQGSGHGTTLVVSNDPAGEVARLGAGVTIAPEQLEPADIVRFGRVDGAVVLGPDGRCYGFGVILDGTAQGRGDPARGSRFNSAVRYQSTMSAGSVLVVISDDGTVDLIPQLRPQADRHDVEAAVQAFAECCEADNVHGEEFGRTHDLVKSLAFYLDDAQCQRVNAYYENEMLRRYEAGGIHLSATSLQPHPDMDESYFL